MQVNFDFYDFQPIREKVNKSCDYFPLEIIRYVRYSLATILVVLLHKNILLKFIIVTWHNSLSNTFFCEKYKNMCLPGCQKCSWW